MIEKEQQKRKTKVFFFPYAGGTAFYYYRFRNHMPTWIEVCPVELAGRGSRLDVPMYHSFEQMIEDTYQMIKDELSEPYAFFGHSMGGLLAYELYYRIRSEELPTPNHLFISGKSARGTKKDKRLYALSDEELLLELVDLGGTSKDLVDSREFRQYYFPLIKSDIKNIESFQQPLREEKLGCDLSVLYGRSDILLDDDEVNLWSLRTNKECLIHTFEGGHFYLTEHVESIANIISNSLSQFYGID
nr:thioesterase [Paenibacillus xylanexedens]